MKDNGGTVQEPWMTGDIVSIVKKEKDVCIRFRKLKSYKIIEEQSRKEIKGI